MNINIEYHTSLDHAHLSARNNLGFPILAQADKLKLSARLFYDELLEIIGKGYGNGARDCTNQLSPLYQPDRENIRIIKLDVQQNPNCQLSLLHLGLLPGNSPFQFNAIADGKHGYLSLPLSYNFAILDGLDLVIALEELEQEGIVDLTFRIIDANIYISPIDILNQRSQALRVLF